MSSSGCDPHGEEALAPSRTMRPSISHPSRRAQERAPQDEDVAKTLQMREIMCERGDFLFAQGIGDLRHCRHAATGSHTRLVVAQRLEQVILALAGKAGNRLRSRIRIGVA